MGFGLYSFFSWARDLTLRIRSVSLIRHVPGLRSVIVAQPGVWIAHPHQWPKGGPDVSNSLTQYLLSRLWIDPRPRWSPQALVSLPNIL